MSIIFKPKIGDHLRKSPDQRVDNFSKEEIAEVIQLRAIGTSYRDCGRIMSRAKGSIGSVIHYYNLQGEIDAAKALLVATKSPCIGVCKLDKYNVCEGCNRSMSEISKAGKPVR
jgi:hypothetical protein